jgi:hemolysin type calcium-binding protein
MTMAKLPVVLAAAGALAILAVAPAAASAAECSIDDDTADPGNIPSLLDSGGYEWDVSEETKSAPANDDTFDFATLADGGGSTTTTPPAPETNSDTYDAWGALFVGPGGDASLGNEYFSPDDNSCAVEDSGRTLAFPALPLSGLTVQRKLFVPSGMPGGVLIQTLSNRTGAPITSDVQIGDTLSNDNEGDLGSDSGTAVRSSSSGDTAISPADLWFVTNDDLSDTSDFTLAHVMDGNGGRERIDFVTQTGTGPATGDVEDNVAWRWSGVTVNPGQTVMLLSVEVQQGVAGGAGTALTEIANATAQANAYEGGAVATLFPILGKTAQAQLANWAQPVKCGGRPVTISGSDVRDVIKGTKKPDVIWAGGGNDKVLGKKGNDRICGGPGKDKLIGGPGKKDVLKGGGGKDKIRQ